MVVLDNLQISTTYKVFVNQKYYVKYGYSHSFCGSETKLHIMLSNFCAA